MAKYLKRGTWPIQHKLEAEFEKFFKPVANKEWAIKKLESFVQGTIKIDDFAVKRAIFAKRAEMEDWHGVQILKRNIKRSIIEELYRTGQQSTDLASTMQAILR